MKRLALSLLFLLSACLPQLSAQDKFQGHTVTSEGAWCWFADPRALHYENASGTINASYLGYIDVHGNVKAMQMDFRTGRRTEVLVRSYFQPDDHNNPTFLVLPDERVLIIYARHTDEAAFYYRVSRLPGDITTLGPERSIKTSNNTTYPSPFLLSDDPEHFYLCWRGIGWHPTIARLTLPDAEDNVTVDWGPHQIVKSTGARPYAKYHSNGKDKIFMTYTTGHPDNEQPNWVYFNAINLNASTDTDGKVKVTPTLEDINGKRLSTIANGPFNVSKTSSYKSTYPLTVVDAPSNLRDWVWQVGLDKQNRPCIAMVRINGGKSQHQYYYAKWTGTAWRLTDLADGGGKFHPSNTEYCYSGGMALDPADMNTIYLSIPTAGTSGNVFEIWKYVLDDAGTVQKKEQITRNSEKNNVRPFVLPGSENSPLRLGWMNGDYQYWMVKQGYPLGYPTAIHCDYAWEETVTMPQPLVQKDFGAKALTAGDSEVLRTAEDEALNAFTLSITLQVSPDAYHGTLFATDTWSYGLEDSNDTPYTIIGGEKHFSTNRLLTSDNWATNSTGTSGDNWPTPVGRFNLTVSYDGTTLCTYRNGLLDQCIPASGLTLGTLRIGGFAGTLHHATLLSEAVSAESIKQMLTARALEALYVPTSLCTDVILPEKVDGTPIAWTSSHPDILAPDGSFSAPETATEVTLTAHMSGSERTFTVQAFPRNLTQNLLAKFDFNTDDTYTDEGGMRRVKDLSACGHDLTLMGTATVDGTLNLTANSPTAFGTNGYAMLPAAVMDSLRSYTVLLTAEPVSLNKAPRFYDFGFNSGNSLFCRANALSAGIKYAGGTTTMVNSSTALKSGEKQRLAVTYDARTGLTQIYLNGTLVAGGTENVHEAWELAAAATCTRNYIGRTQWWDTNYGADNGDYVGTLDAFRLYNTALTVDEICAEQGIRQEDESLHIDFTSALRNPDFEGTYTVLSGSGVTADRAIYVPQDWAVDYTGRDRNDMTILNTECLYASLFSAIPTTENDGRNAYLVRQKWGTSTISLSQACDTLPAGYYQLAARVWQSGLGGSASVWVSPSNADKASASAPANLQEWQAVSVPFRCNGAQTVTFGLSAVHNSDGSEKFLGFDHLTLHDVTANRTDEEVFTLLTEMTVAADALLAGELPTASVRDALSQATDQAKGVTEATDTEPLFAAYSTLRHALRAVHNPGLADGLAEALSTPSPSTAPIYDLQGRQLRRADHPLGLKGLRPGLYLQDGQKRLAH